MSNWGFDNLTPYVPLSSQTSEYLPFQAYIVDNSINAQKRSK
jgi:hypothetical protein